MPVRLIALLAASALTFIALAVPAQSARPDDKKKIVLMWTPRDHPWQSHMYQHECRLLAACLNQSPGINAIISPDPEWPKDPDVLKDAAAIVYYSRQAGDIVLSPAHRADFERMMHSGVGFTAIHWATKAQDSTLLDPYIAVLGGAFHEQPGWGLKTDTRPLIQVDPGHPICRGWKPFDLHEEWYLGTKFHDRAKPLIKVDIDGKDQVLAWVFERDGGGRSFGTTLGHFHDNFAIDSFRKALVNGILWTARVEIPERGAPVELGDDLLRLPAEDDHRN